MTAAAAPITETLTEVAAWLDPAGWDAECWPSSVAELEFMARAHLDDADVTDEATAAAWIVSARQVWESMDAPETDAQRRERERRERAEAADEWAYRRLVEVQAFG